MDTKQRTEEKVFSFMEEHHMLKAHDRVVAGISGGADSVCLLFVLLEWAKRTPLSLAVVHVDHGIRPEAAADARYVEELCKIQGVPFYLVKADVRQQARQEKCSEEEAGRKARYRAFAQAAEDFHADKIAVAHNCNDRSETMLFHLFRGSGIRGLASIRPVRDNIIRPILCLERREVEAYLAERGIACCQDATNETDDYTRNRIRHHILPYAEQEVSAGCVAHMAQTADLLWETEEYLEQQTQAAAETCVRGNIIEVEPFLKQHEIIRRRILFWLLTSMAPSGRDISYVHIRDLLTLFTENGNRSVCLPFGIMGRREYGRVILEKQGEQKDGEQKDGGGFLGTESREIRRDCAEADRLVQRIPLTDGEMIEIRLLAMDGISGDFPQNQYTKWFDYDKIEQSLVLRTRRTGDYLTIARGDGQISHKSVKDYMITEKIPRKEREQIPLIAEGHHVLWLIGYRISEYYKISRNTKHVLQVQLIRKNCGSSETEEKNV